MLGCSARTDLQRRDAGYGVLSANWHCAPQRRSLLAMAWSRPSWQALDGQERPYTVGPAKFASRSLAILEVIAVA